MIIFAAMIHVNLDRGQISTAFVRLGEIIEAFLENNLDMNAPSFLILERTVNNAKASNGWFTYDSIRQALRGIVYMVRDGAMMSWLNRYKQFSMLRPLHVGVVSAGNVPAVGFHDFLCVLVSGNSYIGKLSRDDQYLIPAMAEILISLEPKLGGFIQFTDDRLTGFDAVIATGSGNTARYFEYYFEKYPNIIRRNRNSVVVLTGSEDRADFEAISHDIFDYYGLGCRNASMVLYPDGYEMTNFFDVLAERQEVMEMVKYANNVEYRRAIMLIGQEVFFDTGNLLLKRSESLASPVGVVHLKSYINDQEIKSWLVDHKEEIQCVIGLQEEDGFVRPGRGQYPELWDYADGVDVMEFLFSVKK